MKIKENNSRGVKLLFKNKLVALKRVSGPARHNIESRQIYHLSVDILRIKNKKLRIWSNGKISLCQGEDAGSIPAIRPRVK